MAVKAQRSSRIKTPFYPVESLGDVRRRFEASTNLSDWTEVSPSSLVTLGNLPGGCVQQALFPAWGNAAFFRLAFQLP